MVRKVDEVLLLVEHDIVIDNQSVVSVFDLDNGRVPGVLAEVVVRLLKDLGYTRKLLLKIGVLDVFACFLVSRPVFHLR